jgi:hypothetical protein
LCLPFLSETGIIIVHPESRKRSRGLEEPMHIVRGTINGGGQEIQITNFQGAIYIRKSGAGR